MDIFEKLESGVIVIPKSIHRNRMKQNINIFDFTLTEEKMAAVAALTATL